MQQISIERVYDETRLGGKGNSLGIVQEIQIWPYEQMVYAQTRICPGERDAQTHLGLWDRSESPNLGQTTIPCRIVNFAIPADHRGKLKEGEKRTEKNYELENDGNTNCNWCSRYGHQRIGTGTGSLGNRRTSGDHPNDCIITIGKNSKKCPGDSKRLAITHTLVRNHRLMLVWKTLK